MQQAGFASGRSGRMGQHPHGAGPCGACMLGVFFYHYPYGQLVTAYAWQNTGLQIACTLVGGLRLPLSGVGW